MKNHRSFTAFLLLFSIVLGIAPAGRGAFAQTAPPYRNPKLSFERRVDDLVGRMTLEEKISQMQNAAAAIPRLGVPEYEWWNEALHGVARAGVATVFPQAIGMAATFDDNLIFRVADAISTEARAKHHEAVRQNDFGRYKGLTFWSPNINIFRDPRWGRGQETWGEDPFLTGKLATSFVKGLQGDDPKYLKVVSTVKHFAVHSGPEPERHTFDARVSERDLRETYLPAFRTTILDGKASGVMCAYNRLDGLPACASDKLLVDILRGEWKFTGHVVSDCGAIDDIYIRHKFLKTEAEASALAVRKGTDLTCGREYKALGEAVKAGLIDEKEIDAAVKHLMMIRFRLGMFDPPEMVKYARIPFSENDTPAHHALSLQAARESLVLLKNDKNLLPLRKDLKTLAVIGPNANDAEVLLGNYNGQPSVSVTALEGIREKVSPQTKVLYSQGMYPTGINFEPIAEDALANGNLKGLKAEYFNNRDFSGPPALVRTDARVDFNWGSLSPAKEVVVDNFSVRWTGRLTAPETGRFQLGWRGNGAIRIYLDDQPVIEETQNRRTKNLSKELDFVAGKTYDVRVEYVENANHYASSRLVWSPPSAPARLRQDALDKARQADAVVMVMGISPVVEGEEMDIKTEGFRGGDRTDIALPKPQEDLIKDIQALGKPVVLVTMGGSALALNWENENLPAIIHAWYPGQFGGTAIADVIFGDYNPAGRLPVTFYKSVDDLPPFDDYRMDGRTYRYFKGAPLYPFGYGLSYSKFEYSNLKLKNRIKPGESLIVTATVKNTGKTAGDEVVQLYLSDSAASVPVPLRNLAGVERINLKPNESRVVAFTLTPRQMSVILDNGKRVIEPGDFTVGVGGGQPGFASGVTGKFSVAGRTFEIAGP
ncbi:MAG: glycoside hydrolase family 3 C-terminal domain-containing protein [Acidobacteria bacterium]|nr:glycoside hydrolase family 3 C-terminal domain-containing protein [Acidobacteriota bacterium]